MSGQHWMLHLLHLPSLPEVVMPSHPHIVRAIAGGDALFAELKMYVNLIWEISTSFVNDLHIHTLGSVLRSSGVPFTTHRLRAGFLGVLWLATERASQWSNNRYANHHSICKSRRGNSFSSVQGTGWFHLPA